MVGLGRCVVGIVVIDLDTPKWPDDMMEIANSGLIGCRLAPQINAEEAAHGPGVIQGFFHRRIGQVKPVLQKMNAQHALQPYRWAAYAFRLGIERLDQLAQVPPGNNLLHLGEKLVPARGLAKTFETFLCEGLLAHSIVLLNKPYYEPFDE